MVDGGELQKFEFNLIPAIKREQLHENMRSSIARDLPIVKQCLPHEFELSIAGGGPSLEDTYRDLTGFIAAANGSLAFLLDRDVVPHFCGVCDPSPHMLDIIEADKRVTYFVASTVHPTVFDKLLNAGCTVYRWNMSAIPGGEELLDELEPDHLTIGGGSTMGLRWITLGYINGFRKFNLHGLDSSFRTDHLRGKASHAYPDHQDHKDWVTFDGFQTRPNFIAQVIDFLGWLDRLKEPSVEPVAIKVFGDGLLQSRFKMWKENNPGAHESSDINLRPPISEASERSKYTRMWKEDDYRFSSPGEGLVRTAIKELGMVPPESVIDFGCGTGRAARRFKNRGFKELGIDIAPNSLDFDIGIEFREACLWSLPPFIVADWGFCCDVMEHIPPDKIDAVFKRIRAACTKGAFFQIAFGYEDWGDRIGEVLHLTVQSQDWWRQQMRNHWVNVRVVDPVLGQHKLRGLFVVNDEGMGW